MHKVPILRFNKLKNNIDKKAINLRKGLTIEYIGELDDKFGMAKKKISDVDLIGLKFKKKLFQNPKLNLINRFTFSKQNFQEFQLKKTEEATDKIIKTIENNIIAKMQLYFQKRIQKKKKINLHKYYFSNVTSNNSNTNILGNRNKKYNNYKNDKNKKSIFQSCIFSNKYLQHQTSGSQEISEKKRLNNKIKVKEEKKENENKIKKLYCEVGTNTEESNYNFSPKKINVLPKIQFIGNFSSSKKKLKLSFF